MIAPASSSGRDAERVLRALTGVGALGFVLLFLVTALVRLPYPFDLEWIEGALADHVARVMEGASLYPPPSVDFVPYFYPPLWFWVAAAVAKVAGLSLPTLRAVSVAAALALFAVVGDGVRRETGSRWAGLVAAGLIAATYRVTTTWFDLARVDTLFLALLAAAVHRFRFGRSVGSAICAGALFGLAALTKQTALPAALPMLAAGLLVDRRRAATALAMAAALVIGVGAALHLASDGWSTWYLWTMPGDHGIEARRWRLVWPVEPGAAFAVPIALAGLALWQVRADRRRLLLDAGLLAGLVVASAVARLHGGGGPNTFLPAYVGLALLAGAAVGRLGGARSRWGLVAAQAALALQLALLAYDPRPLVPTAADRARGERFVRFLSQIDGKLLLPWHGFVERAASKAPSAHVGAMYDVMRSHGPARDLLAASVAARFSDPSLAAVVLDRPWFTAQLRDGWRAVPIPPEASLAPPVEGLRVWPQRVYVRGRPPRSPVPGPAAPGASPRDPAADPPLPSAAIDD